MANLKEQAKALYLYGFPLVVTEATHWGARRQDISASADISHRQGEQDRENEQ